VEQQSIIDVPLARSRTPKERSTANCALVIDLDGTLVKTDLLWESLLILLKQKPLSVLLLPIWLLKGKAHVKQQIGQRVSLDVSVLPYEEKLLEYLRAELAAGRVLVLATASDMKIARQVADQLRLFDFVFASDGVTNLSGESKRKLLVNQFGEQGFDYVANGRQDLVVWASARKAIVVNPGRSRGSITARIAKVDRVFTTERHVIDYVKPLRVRHWLKNILIFVPFFAAQRLFEIALLEKVLLGFLAFGCCASAGYVLNDLFDLTADRHHPEKRLRPFASGNLPLSYGVAIIPVLAGVGFALGALISPLYLLNCCWL
jgi:hypothetical protein